MESQVARLLRIPNAFGLTVRYAMKACSSLSIVRLLNRFGLEIDASSGFEALKAIQAGVPPSQIQITAQQIPDNLEYLVSCGVFFNACSLHQLSLYGQLFPGCNVSIRVNPGLGSGRNNRTNTGGLSSSFGIWFENLDKAFEIASKHKLNITGLHSHIGSGSNPEVWKRCAKLTLDVAANFPDVTRLNLGGGFEIDRMSGEIGADLHDIGTTIQREVEGFAIRYGRLLHLEIEPGTYVVGNSGSLLSTVIDVVDTGRDGFNFIKIDSGMTEILRTSLYGAQHPITLVPLSDDIRSSKDYLVVGHCCESGDILTTKHRNPELVETRSLIEPEIGDLVVVDGCGAYCSSMSAKNYNSFPEACEILIDNNDEFHVIRRRQSIDQIWVNESIPCFLE